MTDLTLEEYKRFPPDEMVFKIREDAQKAFGHKDLSPKGVGIRPPSRFRAMLHSLFPFFRLKRLH